MADNKVGKETERQKHNLMIIAELYSLIKFHRSKFQSGNHLSQFKSNKKFYIYMFPNSHNCSYSHLL